MIAAESARDAVSYALTRFSTQSATGLSAPVVIAAFGGHSESETSFSQLVEAMLRHSGRSVRTVAPPSLSSILLGRLTGRAKHLTDIGLDSRAERLSTVTLPASLVDAGSLIVANDLRRVTNLRPVIAIGLWARFGGLRQAIESRLSDPREARAAEIALAVSPTLLLLACGWHGHPIVVSTADQIAAELVGLALHQRLRGIDAESPGPWEDALIQRATELDLGVRSPDQIALRAIIAGNARESFASAFADLVAGIGVRLGVADVSVRRVASTTAPPGEDRAAGLL